MHTSRWGAMVTSSGVVMVTDHGARARRALDIDATCGTVRVRAPADGVGNPHLGAVS